MALWFSWDPAKARSNAAQHGLTFETAARVFLDPFAVTDQDRIEGGEQRWRTTGLVDGLLVVVVAHTLSEDDDGSELIRLISARRADAKERRSYEEARRREIRA
jgi:uncharacterized protein